MALDRVARERTPAVMGRLASIWHLKTVAFTTAELGEVSAQTPPFAAMTSIQINDSTISQGTIDWLTRCPSLGSLVLCGIDNLSDLHFEKLKVHTLVIYRCTLTSAAATRLLEIGADVSFRDGCTITREATTQPAVTRP